MAFSSCPYFRVRRWSRSFRRKPWMIFLQNYEPRILFATVCFLAAFAMLLALNYVISYRASEADVIVDERPCLLSRRLGIQCGELFLGNVTYLRERVGDGRWKDAHSCDQDSAGHIFDGDNFGDSSSNSIHSDSSNSIHSKECQQYRQLHAYDSWPITDQERSFPIAFGLKMHKSPRMLERLLRVLWRPQNIYCIHVDSKADPKVFKLVQHIASCFHNVFLAEVRVEVVYMSVTSLLGDMECMRKALASATPWKYYLNLSGQEFPLKTNLELVQILHMLGGKNDVESDRPNSDIRRWFSYKFALVNGTMKQTAERKAPFAYPVKMRKGSAYGAFSHGFVDYALHNRMARDLLEWLADARAPDELFWATLNHIPGIPGSVPNVPVAHRYHNVLSRAVAWEWDRYKCGAGVREGGGGKYVRGVCIFTMADLPWLGARRELIANKFDDTTDPVVLDCLEEELQRRAAMGFEEMSSLSSATSSSSSSSSSWPRLSYINWDMYASFPHLKNR